MRLLALDLSLKATGWALWDPSLAKPAFGTWELAGSLDYAPRAFCRLQRNIADLHRAGRLDKIVYEEPLPPGLLQRNNAIAIPEALIGLAAHVLSFCEAMNVAHHKVHQATWRRHFIGKMPRGTKSPDLKAMCVKRCRDIGWVPRNADEADALGLLDYAADLSGLTPPWRERALFGSAAA